MCATCRAYFISTFGSVILYLIITPVSCRMGCLQTHIPQGLGSIPVRGRIFFYTLFRPDPRPNQPRIQWLPWLAPSGTEDHSPPFSTLVSVRNRVCQCSGNRVYSGAGLFEPWQAPAILLSFGSSKEVPGEYLKFTTNISF
jgi:hypothetical protein